MAKVRDIYSFLNSIAPFDTQEDWDNSGMLVGNMDAEIQRAAVVLDISCEAIKKAAEMKVDLIISHHPVIFRPTRSFLSGDAAYELAKADINAICMHTSLDSAKGGVNDVLMELLGIKAVHDEQLGESLRGGTTALSDPHDFTEKVQKILDTKVSFTETDRNIQRVAVCGGSGGSFVPLVCDLGYDAFITGEAKHSDALFAKEKGLLLILGGHFETENPITEVLRKLIAEKFAEIAVLKIAQRSPVRYL